MTLPFVRGVAYKEKRRDYVFPGERHPGVELCYVDRGALHAHVSKRRGRATDLLATEGTLLCWLPDEFHSLYAAPGQAPNIVTVHAVGPLPPGIGRLSKQALVLSAEERAVLMRLIEEAQTAGLASRERQSALLVELLVALIRRVSKTRTKEKEAGTEAQTTGTGAAASGANVFALQKMLVEEAGAEIQRRIASGGELGLQSLARALQVSESHLSHTFRAVTATSVMAYARARRLKFAAELLRDSALSITEVARKCGFESIHPFSRAFKKATGFSPRAYARSVRPAPR